MARPYREITFAGVSVGLVTGFVLCVTFTYAALKLGFSIGGSTIASIVGFGVLRGAMKRGSIIEINISQTVASGMNSVTAGVVFTAPALYLMGEEFNPWIIGIAAAAGAVVGTAVIIPLRKQMIDYARLKFPTGVAVSTILRSPGQSRGKFKLLLGGAVLSGAVTVLVKVGYVPEMWQVGKLFGLPEYMTVGAGAVAIYMSVMNFGAGLLAGRGGLGFAVSGLIAYLVISPMLISGGYVPGDTDADMANAAYGAMIRPEGIGMLIGSAIMTVILTVPVMFAAIKAIQKASATKQRGRRSDEMPAWVIGVAVIMSFAAISYGTWHFTDLSVWRSIALAAAGTAWLFVAGIIVTQATGMTDISPMSGMTLVGVTIFLAIATNQVVPAIIVAVFTCVAIGLSADMMTDLKTGFLIGGKPVRQQLVQFLSSWIGAPIVVVTVMLLWQAGADGANGFGPGTDLPAPQAGALSGLIEGIVGGNVPMNQYVTGGIIGGALSFISGLGVMAGLAFYLPFGITFGYFFGCITQIILEKFKGEEWSYNKVVPVAAGFIIGEGLTSVTMTLWTMFGTIIINGLLAANTWLVEFTGWEWIGGVL